MQFAPRKVYRSTNSYVKKCLLITAICSLRFLMKLSFDIEGEVLLLSNSLFKAMKKLLKTQVIRESQLCFNLPHTRQILDIKSGDCWSRSVS